MRYLFFFYLLFSSLPLQAKTSSEMRSLWKESLSSLEDYKEGIFQGKGIVIPAGGEFYLVNAWINVSMLRHLGCQLPIEIWYIGEKEYVPHLIEKLEGLDVKCFDITQVFDYPIKGFEVKAHAILASSFQEVMLLDADNVVLDDPEYLFYATEYMQTGTLFWPDVTTLKPTNPLFETLELKPREVRAQESGQLLIDKKRCWKALNLSVHMNKESDYYYQYIYGDKDTFFLSCLATQTPYAMVNHLPGLVFRSAGGWPFSSFLQRDCQGRPLFCHTVLLNWSERVDFNTMWHYYTLPTQKSDVLYPEYNYKDTQYKSFRVKYKEHERKCIEFLKQVKSFDA